MTTTGRTAQAGEWVLIESSNEDRKIVQLRASESKKGNQATIKLKNVNDCIPLAKLIGLSFGLTYHITREGLIMLMPQKEEDFNAEAPVSSMPDSVSEGNVQLSPSLVVTRDNQFLNDDANNQRLQQDDIVVLKNQLSPEALISKLCDNSSTFATKNEYSQEKYVRRKSKKFMATFRILPLTSFSICQHLHHGGGKKAMKISDLREDSMAQLLALANVRPTANILLMDENGTGGLMVGAILDRLNCTGSLVSVWEERQPSDAYCNYFNLSMEQRSILSYIRTSDLLHGCTAVSQDVLGLTSPNAVSLIDDEQLVKKAKDSVLPPPVDYTNHFDAAILMVTDRFADSCLLQILRFMKFSRNIVIYSPFSQVWPFYYYLSCSWDPYLRPFL